MPHSSAPVVRIGGNVTATGRSGEAPTGGLTPEQIRVFLTALQGISGGDRPEGFGGSQRRNVQTSGANPFQGISDRISGGGRSTRPSQPTPVNGGGGVPATRPQASSQLTNPPGLSALRTPDVDAGISFTWQEWLTDIAQGLGAFSSGGAGLGPMLARAGLRADRETAALQASREPGVGARRGQGSRGEAGEAVGRSGRDLSRGFSGFEGRGR